MGEVTAERLRILRQADVIVLEEMRKAGWYRKVWQSFAVLLPIQTVGVMGDGRTYEHVVAIRAVDSRDAMTADWTKLPYEILKDGKARIGDMLHIAGRQQLISRIPIRDFAGNLIGAVGARIDRAVRAVLTAGVRTCGLGGEASTTEFTEAIVREIERG